MLAVLITSILSAIALGINIGWLLGRSQNKQLLTRNLECCPIHNESIPVQRVYRTVVAVACNRLTPHKVCSKTNTRCMYFTRARPILLKPKQ